ncbi:hypothetical protein [Niveibacterium sp. SC-1]|uniref:hypothetical protein n=1 Tax=Niveibacterium sp. SC-1 TaxID=3135646 RepID=UPI00311FB551
MRLRFACLLPLLLLLSPPGFAADPAATATAFAQCEHWLRELGAVEVPQVADAGDDKSFFFHWKGARLVRLADNQLSSAACMVNKQSGHGQLSINGKPPVNWRPQESAPAAGASRP